MSYDPFIDTLQIDELPEYWTSEEIDLYLESCDWDDDQALEEYSLECAFGPEE